jgi:ActR/RegA family two-component response regulator
MEVEAQIKQGIMLGGTDSPENTMLSKERWEEIRQLRAEQGLTVSEIGRRLEIDRCHHPWSQSGVLAGLRV